METFLNSMPFETSSLMIQRQTYNRSYMECAENNAAINQTSDCYDVQVFDKSIICYDT